MGFRLFFLTFISFILISCAQKAKFKGSQFTPSSAPELESEINTQDQVDQENSSSTLIFNITSNSDNMIYHLGIKDQSVRLNPTTSRDHKEALIDFFHRFDAEDESLKISMELENPAYPSPVIWQEAFSFFLGIKPAKAGLLSSNEEENSGDFFKHVENKIHLEINVGEKIFLWFLPKKMIPLKSERYVRETDTFYKDNACHGRADDRICPGNLVKVKARFWFDDYKGVRKEPLHWSQEEFKEHVRVSNAHHLLDSCSSFEVFDEVIKLECNVLYPGGIDIELINNPGQIVQTGFQAFIDNPGLGRNGFYYENGDPQSWIKRQEVKSWMSAILVQRI